MSIKDSLIAFIIALSLTMLTVEITNSVIRYAFSSDKQDYPEKGK